MDTGRREPSEALGAWLEEVGSDDAIVELRWQSGFFGVDGVGHLVPLLRRLGSAEALVRVLVGSNDGVTRRADLEVLLDLAGSPRHGLRVGVVSFDQGFFHPKVVHAKRGDDSMAAYVGSANLTTSGVASLHVEAGLALDTKDGDDPLVLNEIADAVDWWFTEPRNGFHSITTVDDIDALLLDGVLGVARRPPARPSVTTGKHDQERRPRLKPLLTVPSVMKGREGPEPGPTFSEPLEDAGEVSPGLITVEERWSKTLTPSDAQRKTSGNQRGSITLVKGHVRTIDAQTYFRFQMFRSATWAQQETRTGRLYETATISMLAVIDGLNLGMVDIQVSHEPRREAGQGNYTSLLHLGPLAPYFQAENFRGRPLSLEKRSDETIALTIG